MGFDESLKVAALGTMLLLPALYLLGVAFNMIYAPSKEDHTVLGSILTILVFVFLAGCYLYVGQFVLDEVISTIKE